MVGGIKGNMMVGYGGGVGVVMGGEMMREERGGVVELVEMVCEMGGEYGGFERDIEGG